jgi:hypothetical protein
MHRTCYKQGKSQCCTACGWASCHAESLLWICLYTYQNGHLGAVYGAFELPDDLQTKGGTGIRAPAAEAFLVTIMHLTAGAYAEHGL